MKLNVKHIILLFLMMNHHQFFASQKDSLLSFFEDLKTRTLLVVLQAENPRTIEKLSDKRSSQEVDMYRKAIKGTNDNLMKSVTACWKLNSDIRFIPVDSLEWYKTNFPKKYACLTLAKSAVHSGGGMNIGMENVPRYSNLGLHLFLCDRARSIGYSHFPADEIGQKIPKELKENNVLYSDYYLPSATFIYALYRIQHMYTDIGKGVYPPFNIRNAINSGVVRDALTEELTKKTLIGRLQDCEKGFNPEKAKDYYPYSVKMVSDEEFEKALLNKDPNILCFYLVFASSNTMGGGGASITRSIYIQQVIRANDGATVYGGVGEGLSNKVLKDLAKSMEKAEKKKAKDVN